MASRRWPILPSVLFVGLSFLVSCGDSGPSGPDPLDAIASVSVSPNPASVDVGATTQLNATVLNGRGETVTTSVTWSSSLETVATTNTSGLVTGVAEGTTTISASAGGMSGTSVITVHDPFPPDQPSDVVAIPISNTQVQVTWTDNSNNEDDFRIDREAVVGPVSGADEEPARVYTEVGTVGPDVTTFTDTGLESGTAYNYQVRACNENGCSDPAAIDNAISTFDELMIETAALPAGTMGVAYEQTLTASGGDGTYLWSVSVGDLPDGLTLTTGSGLLSGIPAVEGDFPFTIQVQSGGGQTATANLSIDVVFVFGCSIQTEIPQAECEALETLYNTTNGPGWLDSTNWLADLTPCGWFGVSCGSGSVTRLQLGSNGLAGSLPADLGNLPNLQRLYVNSNQFIGSIPAELGNLTKLTDLYLSANGLTGPIPEELGNLVNLQWLYLQGNQLTGVIPPSLGGLSDLGYMDLSQNQLTGTIPAELGGLSSLLRMGIYSNQLIGEIPSELGDLANLERLELGNNGLTGEIPIEIGSLSNLDRLDLTSNGLTGNVPPELGSLVSLEYLFLAGNELSGPIPAELGNLSNLENLSLQYNQLSGAIPAELGNLTNLGTMLFQSNELTGTIPSELGNLVNLQALSLQSNQLTGAIPSELGSLVNLQSLLLHSNQLTAPVPLAVAQLGGGIQSAFGSASCEFLPGNAGLTLLDTQAYRDADLDSDGFICEVPFPPGPLLQLDPWELESVPSGAWNAARPGSVGTHSWLRDGG